MSDEKGNDIAMTVFCGVVKRRATGLRTTQAVQLRLLCYGAGAGGVVETYSSSVPLGRRL